MKSLPKILKIFFLTIFLLELIGFGLIITAGKTALAADSINLKLQVPIPGGEKEISFNTKSTQPIADYIRVIYKYAIGVVGILATVVMMIGGIMWIMSGGSPERAGEAKAYISASLTGLVLTLCSYLILATVNPALTNFNIRNVQPVAEMASGGCCYSYADSTRTKVVCKNIADKKDCADGTFVSQSCSQISYCTGNLGKDELIAATADCKSRGGRCVDGCESSREEQSGVCGGDIPGITANKICCIAKSVGAGKRCADLNGGSCVDLSSTAGSCPMNKPYVRHSELDNTCPAPSATAGVVTKCCALE